MTFKVLIDLVLLRVNGGLLNDDNVVTRPDVEEYLPIALNKVVSDYADKVAQAAKIDKATSGLGSNPIDPALYRVYELPVQKDKTRRLDYVALPGIVNSMSKDMGFSWITPVANPAASLMKVSVAQLTSMESIADIVPMAWHEVYNGESRIYMRGYPGPLCNMLVQASITKNQYDPEDEMDLPSGLEATVVEMAVAHFKDQRMMPADVVEDSVDVNAKPSSGHGSVQGN